MSDYEIILEEYFELKSGYEKKYQSKKGAIINNNKISKKEKQKLIRNLKMPCIKCKRKVNTVFYDKNGVYGALCGDSVKPCGLNIEISKQKTINLKEQIYDLDEKISTHEFEIKRLKLSHLFGLIDDNKLDEIYQIQKEDYKSDTLFRENLETQLIINTNELDRREQISLLKKEYYETIKEIKDNMKDYMVNDNKEGLSNAVELYVETLTDINDKLRSNKYEYSGIEEEMIKMDEIPNVNIIQIENTKDMFEYILEESEIKSFEI